MKKKNKQLTTEQQQLVIDYIPSAHKFLMKKGLKEDDFIDMLYETLCNCALRYDSNSDASFLTYVWAAYERDLGKFYSYVYRQKRTVPEGHKIIYLDSSTKVNDTFYVEEIVGDEDIKFQDIEDEWFIRKFKHSLTPSETKMLNYLQYGCTIKDMSKLTGYSIRKVYYLFEKIRIKWDRLKAVEVR